MKKQDGVALIATLLIMAAIVALGVGSLFLSNMNLRIAENSRTHTIARYNAEAGIEAALVQLKREYATNKTLPATLTLPAAPESTVRYKLSPNQGYVTDTSGTTAEVRVWGEVLNSDTAKYVAEALVVIGAAKTKLYGIETEGVVDISSGTSIYTDAGVHGNAGVTLGSSDFYVCLSRDASGVCTATEELHASDIPVSTSNNAACSVKGEAYSACERDHQPITVNPDYLAKRDRAIQASNVQNAVPSRTGTLSSANGIYCDKVINATSALTLSTLDLVPNRVICVEGNGNVTVPANSLSSVTIIANGNIEFDKNADVSLTNDTTLISKAGTVSLGKKSSVMNSHIFSQGSVDYNGPNNTFGGVSTIATAGNINIGGSSAIATDSNNNKGIGIAMIAGGNVDINGNSQWFAGIVAGGYVKANGGPTLSGGIQAKGTIEIKGGIDIDSGLGVFNNNLAEMEPNFASRR
jgi:hypothetical protein